MELPEGWEYINSDRGDLFFDTWKNQPKLEDLLYLSKFGYTHIWATHPLGSDHPIIVKYYTRCGIEPPEHYHLISDYIAKERANHV